MTTTEQIIWAHRVDKRCRAASSAGRHGARLRRPAAGVGRHRAVLDSHVQPDHRRPHDLSAPGGDRERSLRVHRQGRGRQADVDRPRVRRRCTAWRSRTTRRRATASSISIFPEQGLVLPGQFIPGADSHSRAYGAYGAVGIGVGSTTLGFGWATGYIYFTLAQAAARRVHRPAQSLGRRQGHRARAAAALGRRSSRRA